MSHSSGIGASQELKEYFSTKNTDEGVRAIRVEIVDELMEKTGEEASNGDAESDFESIKVLMEPKKPCYVCFRLDSKSTGEAFEWMLLAYIPEGSKVRDRMLYASTRFNLKKELGLQYFANDLYGTSAEDDFDWDAVVEAKNKKAIDYEVDQSVMTDHERQMNEEDLSVMRDQGGADSRGESSHSLSFPIKEDAIEAASKMVSGEIQLFSLAVDITEETVSLVESKPCTLEELKSSVDLEKPRFYFFKYPHEYDGEEFDSLVYIYFCPDDSPVKERMILSTIKSHVSEQVEETGLKITKNIECREEEDLEVENVMLELHPPKAEVVTKRAFSKPRAPGKGGRRLVRRANNNPQ